MSKTLSKNPQELSLDELKKVSGGVTDTINIELQNRIIGIITEQLCLHPGMVTPSSSIKGDLGCDSLDMVDLAQALEEEFKVSIGDNAITSMTTVEDIIKYISDRIV